MSILDYPDAYNFEEGDVDEPQGRIWYVSTRCSTRWKKANTTVGWTIYTLRAKSTPFSQSTYTNSSPTYNKRRRFNPHSVDIKGPIREI